MQPRRDDAPWPTAPTAGQTIVMFATHARSGTAIRELPFGRQLAMVTITWLANSHVSAANGVRVWARTRAGSWYETDLKDGDDAATVGAAAPIQVPVLSSAEWKENFIIGHLVNGFSIEYTAGGTAPTSWDGVIALDYASIAVVN